VDVRLGWRPFPSLDVYVGVQDINDATHSEFSDTDLVRRALVLGMNWQPSSGGN
jgi:hypothetical protein